MTVDALVKGAVGKPRAKDWMKEERGATKAEERQEEDYLKGDFPDYQVLEEEEKDFLSNVTEGFFESFSLTQGLTGGLMKLPKGWVQTASGGFTKQLELLAGELPEPPEDAQLDDLSPLEERIVDDTSSLFILSSGIDMAGYLASVSNVNTAEAIMLNVQLGELDLQLQMLEEAKESKREKLDESEALFNANKGNSEVDGFIGDMSSVADCLAPVMGFWGVLDKIPGIDGGKSQRNSELVLEASKTAMKGEGDMQESDREQAQDVARQTEEFVASELLMEETAAVIQADRELVGETLYSEESHRELLFEMIAQYQAELSQVHGRREGHVNTYESKYLALMAWGREHYEARKAAGYAGSEQEDAPKLGEVPKGA